MIRNRTIRFKVLEKDVTLLTREWKSKKNDLPRMACKVLQVRKHEGDQNSSPSMLLL